MVISPGLIEKMEATIEAELVEEDEGKIYTAADLFRLPVSDDVHRDDDDDDDDDELVEEDEGKIYTAADLFRLPVSDDDDDCDCDNGDDADC